MTIKQLSVVALTMVAAFLASRGFTAGQDRLFERSKDLPEIMHLIDRAYVDEVDVGALMPAAFQHALEEVDENAAYLAPGVTVEDHSHAAWLRTGMVLVKRQGYGFVLSVAEGSPASRAQLKAGSLIRRIDDSSTRDLSALHMRSLLAAAEGDIRLLTAAPGAKEETAVVVTPGSFKSVGLVHTVFEDGIHLLRLPQFHRGWIRDLKKALDTSVLNGSVVVLDLRGNASGAEADLQGLAGLFLPNGTLATWVSTKKEDEPILNSKSGKFKPKRFFILQDQGTSRAAESFAAIAKDLEAAVVVGVSGLGLPDRYRRLALPSGGAILMSVQDLKLKSGEVITRAGLKPNLKVEAADGELLGPDQLLQDSLRLIRSYKPDQP